MSDVYPRLAAALADRYRLERELGLGGMATVYLAEDVRHRRKVAVKVLHAELSAVLGTERFLKEIELTANLQHPHILPLFDSGEAAGQLFYVMPFVEGETLRARLEREQQLPIADAVQIAREVADALHYAHDRGVIHRDIKPENILLQGGHALVADFGIALAVQQAGGTRMTQTGLSLGTPQYMAPEQAMGEKTVDARADVYALGTVTYEMLVGEPPFTGPTVQAIIAKVMSMDPAPMTTLRPTVPVHVTHAVATAMSRLPADRFPTAAEFARALASGPGAESTASARTESRGGTATGGARRERWLLTAGAVALAVAAFFAGRRGTAPEPSTGITVSSLVPAPGERWFTSGADFAVSPNGRRIVVRAEAGGWNGLILRSLDSLGSQRLKETTGATFPFWSPDGKSIGFFAEGRLKVIDLASLTIRALCPAPDPGGGTWGGDDVILFLPERSSRYDTVKGAGGACATLELRGLSGDIARPFFFADGRHFLMTTNRKVMLGEMGVDSLAPIADITYGTAVPAAPDYILYQPPGTPIATYLAQRVDFATRKLVGTASKIATDVPGRLGYTSISASAALLVTEVIPRDLAPTVARVGPDGVRRDSLPWATGTFGHFRTSHNGRKVAFGGWRVGVLDVATRLHTDLVAADDPPKLRRYPAWSPGDTAIAYVNPDRVQDTVMVGDVRTGRSRMLFTSSNGRRIVVTDWSPDGRFLAYELTAGNGASATEGWVYDVAEGTSRRIVSQGGSVTELRFSPEGKRIAYAAVNGTSSTLYVQPFPGEGAARPVVSSGATSPRWSGDGRELLYLNDAGAIEAIPVGADGTPSGARRTVASALVLGSLTPASGDVHFDPLGKTGDLIVFVDENTTRRLTLVQNWRSLLPAGR